MKKHKYLVANYLLFLGLTFLLTSLQVSLWPQLFRNFPSPQFWLITLSYWVMGRHLIEGIAMTCLLSLSIAALTSMPLNLILIINLLLYYSGFFFKQRIFSPSSTYLMALSGLGSLLFPILHLLFSWSSENNPIPSPELFHWTLSGLLSAFFSLFLFPIFRGIDELTSKELPSEVRGEPL